jgi:hypothetical protein
VADPGPQHRVAAALERQANDMVTDRPAFLYMLGSLIYYNGESSAYHSQLYEPYDKYPKPIFAIPGNHDGENVKGSPDGENLGSEPSLAAFVKNFCAKENVKTEDAGTSTRKAMIQPNIYWTLETPFATIIGLYTNVPTGGEIKPDQLSWLINELETAPRDKALILALHHPIYSADAQHSGSTHMRAALDTAVAKAGRRPELVLAAMIHNYQRFTKTYTDGEQLPFIVDGTGGYRNLRRMARVDGKPVNTPIDFEDKENGKVTLEQYSDDYHGFLRLEVTPQEIIGKYYIVPRAQETESEGAQAIDQFRFDWRVGHYVMSSQ